MNEEDVEILAEPTGINVAKLAVDYSDGVILGAEGVAPELVEYCNSKGCPVLPYDAQALEDGSYIETYNSFYDNL